MHSNLYHAVQGGKKLNIKDKNLHKIISAVIVGILLVLMVGIVANAWKQKNDYENNGDTDEIIGDADNKNDDTDKNNSTVDNITPDNNQDNTEDNNEEETYVPLFVNYLTGLECTEDSAYKIPYAFVCEPLAPLYGISDSDMTIEIPIENGDTRFLIYKSEISSLGKIGALAETRNYITVLNKFFGGVISAYGCDDIISYTTLTANLHLDLSKYQDKIYKENGKNIYSDNLNIKSITENEGISIDSYKSQSMPFEFCNFGETVLGKTSANTVTLPYSTTNGTILKFSTATDKYTLYKGDRIKVDMLTGDVAEYSNVFVLFADALTYELSSGTETVIETAKKGSGYYITGGTLTEIRWEVDANNKLIFKNLTGNILTVNRGNSYIGYYKSSEASSVVFE